MDGLVDRPTQDVYLFTPEPGGPAMVVDAVCAAVREHGYAVQILRHPQDHEGDFGELAVTGTDAQTTTVDLARDPRRTPPVLLPLASGTAPVLSRLDALANKMGAVLGRGLPRDYIDIAAVSELRDRLADWPRDPAVDTVARAAHARAHGPARDRRGTV